MSFATAVGCGGVGCVVGAEALSETAGVWVKTRFYRDGHFLCATVYSVAAGEPKVFELRVDLRPIMRALVRGHQAMHAKEALKSTVRGKPLVGWSLGKMWKGVKNVAKKIGRSKLVKGVVRVTKAVAKGAKAVVKSKVFGTVLGVAAVFPLTAAFAAPALGAYAAANAAVSGVEAGAKVIKVARSAASLISAGKRAARQVSSSAARSNVAVKNAGASMAPALRAQIAARAKAAGTVKLTAKGKATVASSLARAPAGAARAQVARALTTKLKAVATLRTRTVLAKSLPPKAGAAVIATTKLQFAAAPVIAKAAAVTKKLADPKVRAELVAIQTRAAQAQAALETVQKAAGTGSLDAQKTAAIINLTARNRARIQAMSQASAGGLPGVLITSQGRLVRGRFRVQASAGANGVLYQGPGKPGDRGRFATVSGIDGCYAVGARPRRLSSGARIDVAGDLPLDGVRLSQRHPAAGDIGPYEVGQATPVGCDCRS